MTEGYKLVEPTDAMIEAGCRALHEAQGSGDPDAPRRSSYQESWEEPDSVRWKQWIETVTEIGAAMIAAAPEPLRLSEAQENQGFSPSRDHALDAATALECAGFLRDQAASNRDAAANLVGGMRNRMFAEADDLERWADALTASYAADDKSGPGMTKNPLTTNQGSEP